MNSLSKEYDDFMEWFKSTHPDIYKKYGRNISIPFEEGGGVTVNNSFKISDEEHEMVLKIAQSYYNPDL